MKKIPFHFICPRSIGRENGTFCMCHSVPYKQLLSFGNILGNDSNIQATLFGSAMVSISLCISGSDGKWESLLMWLMAALQYISFCTPLVMLLFYPALSITIVCLWSYESIWWYPCVHKEAWVHVQVCDYECVCANVALYAHTRNGGLVREFLRFLRLILIEVLSKQGKGWLCRVRTKKVF